MNEAGYRPLDLSPYWNAGLDVLGGGQAAVGGEQLLHGLPFRIGEGANAVVLFGDDEHAQERKRLNVAIDAAAPWVLVAHRLLGSRLSSGGPVGEIVALYTFRLADGTAHPVPIRERF